MSGNQTIIIYEDSDKCHPADALICQPYFILTLVLGIPALFGFILWFFCVPHGPYERIRERCNECREARKSPEQKNKEQEEENKRRELEMKEYHAHLHVKNHYLPKGYSLPPTISVEVG